MFWYRFVFLGQKSIPATEEDLQVGRDLQDTLAANREACVGMAANMIGVKKRIIIVNAGFRDIIMFNPVIVRKSGPYETEEGCLSLPGVVFSNSSRSIRFRCSGTALFSARLAGRGNLLLFRRGRFCGRSPG